MTHYRSSPGLGRCGEWQDHQFAVDGHYPGFPRTNSSSFETNLAWTTTATVGSNKSRHFLVPPPGRGVGKSFVVVVPPDSRRSRRALTMANLDCEMTTTRTLGANGTQFPRLDRVTA